MKKSMTKLGKVLLLIAIIFSYISSPIAVLADEIVNAYELNINTKAVDSDSDGKIDSYKLYVVSEKMTYDDTKEYILYIDKEKSVFKYLDGSLEKVIDKENKINVTGNMLNEKRQVLTFKNVTNNFNGEYEIYINVVDKTDDSVINNQKYTFKIDNKSGLTGTLNGETTPEEEKIGENTIAKYNVTNEGIYTPKLKLMVGSLNPNKKYNVSLNNNVLGIFTSEEIIGKEFTGTKIDLTNKLFGKYKVKDEIILEEVICENQQAKEEEKTNNVVNKYVYTYETNITYGENNDKLLNDLYKENNIKFANGYLLENAKGYLENEKMITVSDIESKLIDTNIKYNIKDLNGNILSLNKEEELKNGYVVEFISGAAAIYKVVVVGDNNLDNIFDKNDLKPTINDYLENKNVPSMDLIHLEKEDLDGNKEIEKFGTVTLEDLMHINELLKDKSDITSKRELNKNLKISLSKLPEEIYEGDTLKLDLILIGENPKEFIDGFEGNISLSSNLKLESITFNPLMTGVFNKNGKFVSVGSELKKDSVLATITLTCTEKGEAAISIDERTAKYLTIEDKFTTIDSTFNIKSKLSSNNNLLSLKASVGTFDIDFSKENTVYNLTVPYDTESVILSGELDDVNSTVSGLIEYKLTGDKTLANIIVTAEDGTTKTYTVYIIKEAKPVVKPIINNNYYSDNNNLKELEIKGYDIDFSKDINEYVIKVDSSVESLDIRALTEHSEANVEITGNEKFKSGENIVTISVIAENGDVKEYKLIVNKSEEMHTPLDVADSSNNAEKIVIIVLIVLVVLGLLYLIFKKDDEEEIVTTYESDKKEKDKNSSKKNKK